jgi:DNA polymerase III delta prime subunit
MKPTKPSDFIGRAGQVAHILFAKVPQWQTGRSDYPLERCQLFLGPPGLGKSALAEALANAVAGHPLAIEQLNAQSCTIEAVRGWRQSGAYRPLIGSVVVRIVDEIDAMSPAACNEIRSYLDKLPESVLFLATTNRTLKELQEQLQSRFQVWQFKPVPTSVLAAWLVEKFELTVERAHEIAQQTSGNVRAAIGDALSTLDVRAAS